MSNEDLSKDAFGVICGVVAFIAGIVVSAAWLRWAQDIQCRTVAAGQDFKRDGTECYVVRENGVLEPVRWKP